jgi:hypothetical protein
MASYLKMATVHQKVMFENYRPCKSPTIILNHRDKGKAIPVRDRQGP